MMVAMALVPHSVGLSLMLLLSAVVWAEKLLTRAVYHLGVVAAVLAFAAIVVLSGRWSLSCGSPRDGATVIGNYDALGRTRRIWNAKLVDRFSPFRVCRGKRVRHHVCLSL